MAIVSASRLKGYFGETDAPTCANFADLIDSLFARGSAAGTAQAIQNFGGGAAGTQLFISETTASTQGQMGFGTVGGIVVNQGTTASAQTVFGGGIVGRTVFGAITTASAHTAIGGGVAGRTAFEAITTASARQALDISHATTAQAAAGVNASSLFMTPDTVRFNPFAVRAHVTFTCAGAILQSERVSSVGKPATGRYDIKWRPALPTADYTVLGMAMSQTQAGVAPVTLTVESSVKPTVSAMSINCDNRSNGIVDPNDAAFIAVFCSGI